MCLCLLIPSCSFFFFIFSDTITKPSKKTLKQVLTEVVSLNFSSVSLNCDVNEVMDGAKLSILGNCRNMAWQHVGLFSRGPTRSADIKGHSKVMKTLFLFSSDYALI